MAYYDSERRKLKLDLYKLKRLDVGGCAEIFSDENIIFKIYFSNVGEKYRITPDMFKLLKTIDSPHFIKLYDMYIDRSIIELLLSRKFRVDAYTAKYYEKENINVLTQPVDYLLDNFRELEVLFDIFTSEHILTDDIKYHNTVLTSNSVTIIDPDCFYFCKGRSEDEISYENKKNLWKLFQSMCINSYNAKKTRETTLSTIMCKCEPDDNLDYKDMAAQLSKRLKPYKKTIDYFRK